MAATRRRVDQSEETEPTGLGSRLRRERVRQQIGLRELARRIGVSPSLISQIETGKSDPSVSTLSAIASELDLSVNEILFDSGGPGTRRRASISAAGDTGAGEPVQRADARRSIHLETGVTWERLTAHADPEVDFLSVTYEPGGASTPSETLMRHSGTEYGVVLSGRLVLTIGFEDYELGPGDSISFPSTLPHRLANNGDEPVRAVWVVVGRHQDDREV